jgi:hypothetical protein
MPDMQALSQRMKSVVTDHTLSLCAREMATVDLKENRMIPCNPILEPAWLPLIGIRLAEEPIVLIWDRNLEDHTHERKTEGEFFD